MSPSSFLGFPRPSESTCGYLGLCAPTTTIFWVLHIVPAGAAAYNTLSENTTKTIAEFRDDGDESARRPAPGRDGPHFRILRPLRYQTEPRRGRPRRTLHVLYQPPEAVALGVAYPDGRVEDLLGDL